MGGRYLLVLISIIVSRCVLFSNENELCANYITSLFVVCHARKLPIEFISVAVSGSPNIVGHLNLFQVLSR